MKISTKGRYALRMMIDLAKRKDKEIVSLTEIAERQGVSKKYLEQIIPVLTNAGLLRTVRGSRGGCALARPAEKCTVGEILLLTEGSLSVVDCAEENPPACPRAASCPTLPIYRGLNKVVKDYLFGITLADVLKGESGQDGDDYVI